MIPIVIVAVGLEEQLKQIKKLLPKFINDPQLLEVIKKEFPFQHPDCLILSTEKANLGIELVRTLKKTLSQRPYQAKQRVVLILEAEKLTPEAQNALLKTLEEPPRDTIIILALSQKEMLLPTILSRTHIITTKNNLIFNQTKSQEYRQLLEKILRASPGKRLCLAEEYSRSREEASIFLQELIFFWHQLLISRKKPAGLELLKIKQALEKSQEALFLLKGNINTKLVIDNLFLNLF